MGCMQSIRADPEAKARNDKIEEQIAKDRLVQKNEIKILLLEAGTGRKSKFLTQMKLNYGGYNNSERNAYKKIIFSNIIQSMRCILEVLPKLDLTVSPQHEDHRSIILSLPSQTADEHLLSRTAEAIRYLWQDPAIQQAVSRSNEFQFNDNAVYYFIAIDRIASPEYMPTDRDILNAAVKTTGITETTFKVGELTYRVVDMANNRSERKKWIHCFENVTALIFVASLIDYDEPLDEDENGNRMQEALTFFDSICNSRWFVTTSIILFLNDVDRLAEKLSRSPLENYFPDYRGGANYDAACDYMLHRFVSLNQNTATKQIHAYYTCASDTQQMKFFTSSIQDIILQLHIRRLLSRPNWLRHF